MQSWLQSSQSRGCCGGVQRSSQTGVDAWVTFLMLFLITLFLTYFSHTSLLAFPLAYQLYPSLSLCHLINLPFSMPEIENIFSHVWDQVLPEVDPDPRIQYLNRKAGTGEMLFSNGAWIAFQPKNWTWYFHTIWSLASCTWGRGRGQ